MLITPELHGSINYNIKNKSLTIEVRMDGIEEPLPIKALKQPRVFYNIGAGIMLKVLMKAWNMVLNIPIPLLKNILPIKLVLKLK